MKTITIGMPPGDTRAPDVKKFFLREHPQAIAFVFTEDAMHVTPRVLAVRGFSRRELLSGFDLALFRHFNPDD